MKVVATDNNKSQPLPFSTEKEGYDRARRMIERETASSSPSTNDNNVSTSRVFHFISAFYSERKLVTFMLNYFAILCVVFTHFALTTGNEDWEAISYYLKDTQGFTKWFLTRFALIEAGGTYTCFSYLFV